MKSVYMLLLHVVEVVNVAPVVVGVVVGVVVVVALVWRIL
jgi:hypothetical protein